MPLRGKQPQMLNRFLDGLMHPMIHVGHGLEFGLPGTVAEGAHCVPLSLSLIEC